MPGDSSSRTSSSGTSPSPLDELRGALPEIGALLHLRAQQVAGREMLDAEMAGEPLAHCALPRTGGGKQQDPFRHAQLCSETQRRIAFDGVMTVPSASLSVGLFLSGHRDQAGARALAQERDG